LVQDLTSTSEWTTRSVLCLSFRVGAEHDGEPVRQHAPRHLFNRPAPRRCSFSELAVLPDSAHHPKKSAVAVLLLSAPRPSPSLSENPA
jgi:hypothetical protein